MLNVGDTLFPALRAQMINRSFARDVGDEGIHQPHNDRGVVEKHIKKIETVATDEAAREYGQEHQFGAGETAKTERDAEAELLARNAQKAGENNKKQDQAELHHANRALQRGDRMNDGISSERIRCCDDNRDQQHYDAGPFEHGSSKVFQSVIRPKDIQENLVNNLEAQDRVHSLAQPEQPEVPGFVTLIDGKSDGKKHYLRHEVGKEHWKLLLKLPTP